MPDNFPKSHTLVRWRETNPDTGRPVERTVTVPRHADKDATLAAAADAAGVFAIAPEDVIEIRHVAAALRADGSPADPSTSTFQEPGDTFPPDNSYRRPPGCTSDRVPRENAPHRASRPPKWLNRKEADPDANKPGHED